MKLLLDARDAGSELVVIDPRYSATAMHATRWLAPRASPPTWRSRLDRCASSSPKIFIDAPFAMAYSSAPLLVRLDNGRLLRAGDGPAMPAHECNAPGTRTRGRCRTRGTEAGAAGGAVPGSAAGKEAGGVQGLGR